jgi:hypothetical protein
MTDETSGGVSLEDRLREVGRVLDAAARRPHASAAPVERPADPSRSGRRTALLAAAAAVAIVAAGVAVLQRGGNDDDSAPSVVADQSLSDREQQIVSRGEVVSMTDGYTDLAHGAEEPLVSAARALTGTDAPLGIESSDGQRLYYASWDEPTLTPSIRVRDHQTGDDTVVAAGAISPALSATGALAYAKGTDPAYRDAEPYLAQVEVRQGSTVETWTPVPAAYLVRAWAGNHLIVEKDRPIAGDPADLVVLDGPGQERMLVPEGRLVAVSPDGSTVLVSRPGGTEDQPADALDLMDVAPGAVLSTVDLSGIGHVPGPFAAGTWVGSTAWAATGGDDGVPLVLELNAPGVTGPLTVRATHDLDPARITVPMELWVDPASGLVHGFSSPPDNGPPGPDVHWVGVLCGGNQPCAYADLPYTIVGNPIGYVVNPSRPLS